MLTIIAISSQQSINSIFSFALSNH